MQTGTRDTQITIGAGAQAAALAVMIAGASALGYLAIGWMSFDRLAADKDAAVRRVETANADLQDDLAVLRDKLGAVARERTQAQNRLYALTGQAGALRGLLYNAETKLGALQSAQQQQRAASEELASWKAARIAELTRALAQAEHQLRQVEAQRATLSARLNKTEADRHAEQENYAKYKQGIAEAEKKLRQLGVERDKAANERDRLRERIAELEKKLAQRQTTGRRRLAEAAPAAAAPRQSAAARAVAPSRWRKFKRVLASTGVDVEQLFSHLGTDRAEGGPFVPAKGRLEKGARAAALTPASFAAMRGLIRSLPMSLPLPSYRLESGFGERRDPINHRHSFHPGLDLSARYMSPVYATAPGVVTYAGYRGAYGKVVEIDHGHGISTFYAHLHRYTVSVGQRVREGAQIGYLGSTGRTTGPHVHYEVRVNGEPQDPEKFVGLARLIPVAAR